MLYIHGGKTKWKMVLTRSQIEMSVILGTEGGRITLPPKFFKNSTDAHASRMSQFSSSLNQGLDAQASLSCASWNLLEMFL